MKKTPPYPITKDGVHFTLGMPLYMPDGMRMDTSPTKHRIELWVVGGEDCPAGFCGSWCIAMTDGELYKDIALCYSSEVAIYKQFIADVQEERRGMEREAERKIKTLEGIIAFLGG